MANSTQMQAAERFQYHELKELEQLSDAELHALWDKVPGEHQRYLEKRYAALKKKHSVVQDSQEQKMVGIYLQKYDLTGYVPTGLRHWANVEPGTIREIVEAVGLEDLQVQKPKRETEEKTSSPVMMYGFIAVAVVIGLFILSRFIFSGDANEGDLSPSESPTITLTPTATATSTPLPTNTPLPTLTPYAFTNVDEFVGDGDRGNQKIYPVALTIDNSLEQPRVFLVQERAVELAEWIYEPNADVATWLSQSLVRPVLAIPYSESNEALMLALDSGHAFRLRMNTGTELVFNYIGTNSVLRNDTSFFVQDSPGIVLALVGKVDGNGMPTSETTVVTGAYQASAELDQLALLQNALAAQGDTLRLGDFEVAMTAFNIQADFLDTGSLAEFVQVRVDVSVRALVDNASLDLVQFSLLDQRGSIGVPVWTQEYPLVMGVLAVDETRDLTIPFLVSREAGQSEFRVSYGNSQVSYQLFLTPPPVLSVDGLDVQIIDVSHDDRAVYISVRIFNAQQGAVYLAADEVAMVFGYVPQPIGVQHSPEMFSGLTLQAGQSWDVDLHWNWNGRDPYAMFYIAGRSYALEIIEDEGRN